MSQAVHEVVPRPVGVTITFAIEVLAACAGRRRETAGGSPPSAVEALLVEQVVQAVQKFGDP